jgi:hypothetical protein
MTEHVETERQGTLNKRLEDIGWGLFLMMIGVLWLVPDATVPQGTWVIGAGLIMIGVNAVRHKKGIRVNGFSTSLGVLALAAGLASISGIRLPLFPIVLVAIGAMILLKPFFTRTA